MENGYKNWPIVRKMLIDNRLEHAALLAYSIGVSETVFTMRARSAFRKVEVRVADAVEIANDTLNTVANAVQEEEDKASRMREQGFTRGADEATPPIDPPVEPVPPEGEAK